MGQNPNALLEALDPEQRQVAMQVTGPLSVLAGAGTGKTRAITYRLAYGTAIGAFDPGSVLAVTFTQRAAAEMRTRLRDLGVPGAQARTFHSAALRQLRYFWPRAIGGPMRPIMDYKAPIVANAAKRLGLSIDKTAIRDMSAEIEWAKVSMVGPDAYVDAATTQLREAPADLDLETMATLLSAYEDSKDERGVIDFEDVLLLLTGLLQERDDIARAVRSQYRNFIVDEFQDVSALQFALLQEWLGGRHDVCVVGDVAQTIYSFAGADPAYLVNFEKYHPGARRVQLNRDYRSTPQIVSIANKVLEGAAGIRRRNATSDKGMPEGAVRLKSQRPSGPAVSFASYADDQSEAAGIAAHIKSLTEDGVPLQDIAILYRTNAQSEAFEQALADAGIGFIIRGGEKFFEREEIRRAMVILRQLVRIKLPASSVNPGEEKESKNLEVLAKPEQVDASGLGLEKNTLEAVKNVASGLGWTVKPPSGQGAVREKWESLDALVNLAIERENLPLAEFVQELNERAEAQLAPTISGVTLSSLHAAKGLEWEAVFLAGASEGLLPISLAKTPESIEEERRLLYVGVTRAKTHLVISYAKSRGVGRSKTRENSRFLDSIWPVEEIKPIKPRRVAPKLKDELADASEDVKRLFETLRQWRLELSREISKPAYTIFTDRTLMAIADVKPETLIQLRTIPGIGATKSEKYGADVLRIIRDNAGE
ncbi:ATP-dependent DNA helicase UvrD2 [uncultured Actinomyces sp.]|uniref:ATP-dependent DNA helicase UvrD2 n=1 Tax=uncultured Actinomyces sp. TaxID=249061 RepID=UPI00261EC94C|nr:ATP-dependent DNA helicase UvrD2 [uncultured Actinomyces sp.]